MNNELTLLRQFLTENFSIDELKTLCFDLGIDYEELGGEGRSAKVRELLLFSGRNHKFEDLLNILQRERKRFFNQAKLSTDPVFIEQLYKELPSLDSLEELDGAQSLSSPLNVPVTPTKEKKSLPRIRTKVWVATMVLMGTLIVVILWIVPNFLSGSMPSTNITPDTFLEDTLLTPTLSDRLDSPTPTTAPTNPLIPASGPDSLTPLATVHSLPVQLPDGSTVMMIDSTGNKYQYTILSAQRKPLSPGKYLLHLRIRAWTDFVGGMNFWDDSFRLVHGDLRLAPVSGLNELVKRDETVDGDVEFEIDDSLKDAILVISVGANFSGNTNELRLRFP